MGINPSSDARLAGLMQQESVTPETAFRELQLKQKHEEMLGNAANARNPYNDPSRSSAQVVEKLEIMGNDGSQYREPYDRPDKFTGHLPYTPAPGSDMTPMQAHIHNLGIDHNNW